MSNEFEDNTDYIEIPSTATRVEFIKEDNNRIKMSTNAEETPETPDIPEIPDIPHENDNEEITEGLSFVFEVTDNWSEGYNASLGFNYANGRSEPTGYRLYGFN